MKVYLINHHKPAELHPTVVGAFFNEGLAHRALVDKVKATPDAVVSVSSVDVGDHPEGFVHADEANARVDAAVQDVARQYREVQPKPQDHLADERNPHPTPDGGPDAIPKQQGKPMAQGVDYSDLTNRAGDAGGKTADSAMHKVGDQERDNQVG